MIINKRLKNKIDQNTKEKINIPYAVVAYNEPTWNCVGAYSSRRTAENELVKFVVANPDVVFLIEENLLEPASSFKDAQIKA